MLLFTDPKPAVSCEIIFWRLGMNDENVNYTCNIDCDNSINWGSLGKGLPSDECNYACPGDNGADICGGSNSFSIYSISQNL